MNHVVTFVGAFLLTLALLTYVLVFFFINPLL